MKLDDIRYINFKQPKYMIPAIIYIPLLFTAYMVCDMFAFTPEEKGNGMETTEYLNSKLPDANLQGDGIDSEYDSMLDAYGKITDKTAVKDAGEDSLRHEEYETKYKDAEVAALDESSKEHQQAMEHLRQLRNEIRAAEQQQQAASADRTGGNTPDEDKTLQELQEALAEAKNTAENSGSVAAAGVETTGKNAAGAVGDVSAKVSGEAIIKGNPAAVTAPTEETPALEVVKVQKKESEYFNTIASNESETKLIKAIIDEDVKAVDGSRVRLRLLDDLQVGVHTIPTGTYLYAIMSGFGSQRVKGQVSSVLIGDDLLKISLSIYDTDGLEGLYVPESNFREVGKDVAAGALSSGGGNFFDGSAPNTLVQMGYQAIQNGYSKISNAISKAVRKNKAKLKYGTFVYLINSQEKEKADKKKERELEKLQQTQQQDASNIYSRYMMNMNQNR